jgi:DNA invertase Pin-like site-specific DNA recombinase
MRYVAYRRVSTDKQGKSGLGLQAQDAAILAHVGTGDIVATYTEVESGKRSDRPELAKALAHARRIKATLVFAKLDRLARNARFLLGIVESNVSVVFCDFPTIPEGPTGKFILTQMAAVAELEAGLIAQRTKAALAAAKARGTLLGASRPGAWHLDHEASVMGAAMAAAVLKEKAREAYADILPWMQELRDSGLSLQAIADRLNAEGHSTRRGVAWNKMQVGRVLSA